MSDTAQFEVSPPASGGSPDPLSRPLIEVRDSHSKQKLVLFSVGIERALLGLSSAVALTAFLLCLRQPEQSWAWLLAGAFLPAVLLGLRLTPSIVQAPQELRAPLAKSLLIAGTLIWLPLLLRLAEGVGAIDAGGVRRLVGVLLGGALIVIGSYLPEQLKPIADKRLEPAVARRILRFAGVGIMLAGGLYGATWLVAPLSLANLWASTVLAGAALFIGARSVLLARQRNR